MKLPVTVDNIGTVFDADGRTVPRSEIVAALNAQQPECKTCGECEHFMHCTHERKTTHNKKGECSDWLPKAQKDGGLLERLKTAANECPWYSPTKPGCKHCQQAAERIEELEKALDDVHDWLDTSSLQEVLVHNCKDSKTDALIMGIASHLTRIEAALGEKPWRLRK